MGPNASSSNSVSLATACTPTPPDADVHAFCTLRNLPITSSKAQISSVMVEAIASKRVNTICAMGSVIEACCNTAIRDGAGSTAMPTAHKRLSEQRTMCSAVFLDSRLKGRPAIDCFGSTPFPFGFPPRAGKTRRSTEVHSSLTFSLRTDCVSVPSACGRCSRQVGLSRIGSVFAFLFRVIVRRLTYSPDAPRDTPVSPSDPRVNTDSATSTVSMKSTSNWLTAVPSRMRLKIARARAAGLVISRMTFSAPPASPLDTF
mmetsp:Transcript_2260/g.8084  ORF Transcript_2260/g.8084 Transcript_2260/m.8084 type:complete len:259 (+) Transcript_2260:2272-3048(+)